MLTDWRDEAAFANAVLSVINSPKNASELRANGYENVRRFDVSAMIDKYLEIYQRIAERCVG